MEGSTNVEKLGHLTCGSEFSDLKKSLDLAPVGPCPMEQSARAEGQLPALDGVFLSSLSPPGPLG